MGFRIEDISFYGGEKMTREEAIEILKEIVSNPLFEKKQSFEMAIKALEQEPCEDYISREAVQNYVESYIQEINTGYGDLNNHTNRILRMIVDGIENMSSVQPKEIYNKGWKDGAEATAYHVELCEEENPTIPMTVIEDIKAEIVNTVCEERKHCDGDSGFLKWCAGLGCALDIIDKHIEDIGGK